MAEEVNERGGNRLEDYLVNIDFDTQGVPAEIYISFPKSLTDIEFRKRVVRMWKCGNNRTYALAWLLFNKSMPCIFKPRSVSIDYTNDIVKLVAPNGLQYEVEMDWFKTYDVEEFIRIVSDYCLIVANVTERPNELVTVEYRPLKAISDVDTAKELLSKYHPIEILIRGLGYKFEPPIIRIMLPRLVAWFRNGTGRPIHVFQLTPPNTGKTTYGLRSETLLSFEFLNEVPTLARLVFDSRYNAIGPVFTRNGIIFDEFDKWYQFPQRVQTILSTR